MVGPALSRRGFSWDKYVSKNCLPELWEILVCGNLWHISQKNRFMQFKHSQISTSVKNNFLQHLCFFRLAEIWKLKNCGNIISLHITPFELESCCVRHCSQITSRLPFSPNWSQFLFIGLKEETISHTKF